MYQGNDCMSQISGLLDCYGQVQAATAFIKQVLASTPMAMKGVTDGSNAQPGQIGEWVQFFQAVNYPANAADLNQVVTMGVLQPGDWNCYMFAHFTTLITYSELSVQPTPPTMSNAMWGDGSSNAGATETTVVCPVAQMSISVPTLIPVLFKITNAAAGTADIWFNARRMR